MQKKEVIMDNDKSIKILTRSKLRPFRYHPYKVKEDEDMANLVNSIKEEGVISPIIVRKVGKDNYEILSGHRRFKACQILDIKEIPVIVKDIQMPEAAIYVVDSNLQRENLLPSEKAFAYKLKYDALKHQGKISDDITSCQLGTKYDTDSAKEIARKEGTSRRQIFRYIRLTNLNKGLLDYLDQGRIAFNPAVELSYLSKRQQDILLEVINDLDATPSFSQSQYLRQLAKEGKYNEGAVYDVLDELKPNQKENLKINLDELRDYFDRGTTPNEMIKIIKKSLAKYYLAQNSKKEENDLKI